MNAQMPRRLLLEPDLLAHELRTPLSILIGWISLIRDGDIDPQQRPERWADAMRACQDAAARLNLIIDEACYEADAVRRLEGDQHERFLPEELTTIGSTDDCWSEESQIRTAPVPSEL